MDAFAGLDGLNGSSSKKNVSLADRMKEEEASKRKAASAWDSLDLLDPAFQTTPKPAAPAGSALRPAAPPLSTAAASRPAQIEDDDVFGLFSSAPPKPQAAQPQVVPPTAQTRASPNPTANSKTSAPASRTTRQPSPATTQATREPPRAGPQPSRPASSRPSDRKYSDRDLAYLVDMGFEPEDAGRALNAMDGQVRGAVNYLMAEAQGLPLPKPKQSASKQLANLGSADFGEFGAAASQFGASMFSRASTLWSKGRKEIEKAYNQYNGQPAGDSDQPAWMRDKAKYDARLSRLAQESDDAWSTAGSAEPDERASQAQRPQSPRAPSARPSPPSSIPTEMPQRPSRAELFRKKQAERELARGSSSPAGSRPMTPVSASAAANEPAEPVEPAKPAEPAEPEVDLLNLGGPAAQPQLSSTQSDMYSTSRELGSEAYKVGNYESAVEHYSAALGVVPDGNVLRALLLSNRSAALMKVGNARAALDDTDAGLKLLPNRGAGLEAEGKPMSEIWVKLVTRNAQAAEQLEKFDVAIVSYQLLLDNGHATTAILDSKRRCIKALNPDVIAKAQAAPKPTPKRRGWGTTGAAPTSASGKAAVEKVKSDHKQQLEDERQKDLLRDRVAQRVDSWKANNETNLRALLSTLHIVLWEGSGWTPVAASDLVVPKKVRVCYMKAVARTHPDKVPSSTPVEVRMIAESVFITIQKAWETFRVENNL